MASISSVGIGSGLDVNSIVSQLVAVEKQPLKLLQAKADQAAAQVTALGQIQSQFSALQDVATRISSTTAWTARTATSSNTAVATVTAAQTTAATNFTLDVDALAQKQSITSSTYSAATAVGAGTMSFRLGTWSGGAFAAATGSIDVAVDVTASDTLATLATKINAANAGVVATVFSDGTQQRLLLNSKDTGEAAGFRVQVSDADLANTDSSGLSNLAFDPETGSFGMAASGVPASYGQDAKARINGLAVTSKNNTLTDNIPGVTINLLATTTVGYGTGGEVKAPIAMSIKEDVTPAVKNVQDFVTAYNALSASLADLTKYDASTKTASLFQADSSILGLQSVLRGMVSSISNGSAYQRLNDVGLERQLDGSLSLNTTKLATAANNGTELQKLFTTNNGVAGTNGFALKFAALARGVLSAGGAVTNKAASLQGVLKRNADDQTKVNDRASLTETRLRAQYTALDVRMASLTALNQYVAQQVTAWNKSTG